MRHCHSDPPKGPADRCGFLSFGFGFGGIVSGNDIFISYSREDRAAAKHFAECFSREGFSVWWDAVLRSGQTFDEVIEKELRAAKAAVVLWSPRSVASRWVRAEATLADRGNKLVPAIIERCDLPIIFELTHAADLSKWNGDTSDPAWQTLVSDLRRLVGNGEEAAPPPVEAPKAPPSPASKRKTEDDELISALERIAKPKAPNILDPEGQHDDVTQFFQQSDVFRMQEGDRYHCLQRLDDALPETRYVVTPTGLTLGRTPPADIIVSGSAVSRAHCVIELSGDKLRVTDLNSTNGTFVDNKRVEGSAMLPVGSVLRVGNVLFEHEVSEQADLDRHAKLLRFANDLRPGARAAKS